MSIRERERVKWPKFKKMMIRKRLIKYRYLLKETRKKIEMGGEEGKGEVLWSMKEERKECLRV